MSLAFRSADLPGSAHRLLHFAGRGAAVASLLLALAGCQDAWFAPQKDRALRQAMNQQAAGDFAAAAASYEDALDGTARTAETHFRLALLCNDKLNDPLGAAYHLRRYLKLTPEGPHAREAKTNLERTEMTLATNLGGGTLLTRSEALKIKNENTELRRQVAELQVQVQTRLLASSPPAAGGSNNLSAAARAAEAKARLSGKTYQVQPGDTLAIISRKVYKNKAKWKDLHDANLNQLGDPPKLKPGMVLLVP